MRIDHKVILLVRCQSLLRRLIGVIIFLVVPPQIEAVPCRIAVLDEKLGAREIDIARAYDRLVVVLADDSPVVRHLDEVAAALAQRLYGIGVVLIAVRHIYGVIVVRFAVELCAKHGVVHRCFTDHRIHGLMLRLTCLRAQRYKLPFGVFFQLIFPVFVELRRAVLPQNNLILIVIRFTETDCPGIALRVIQIFAEVSCTASVMAFVVAQHADFHAETQPVRAVFPQLGHRTKYDLPILIALPPGHIIATIDILRDVDVVVADGIAHLSVPLLRREVFYVGVINIRVFVIVKFRCIDGFIVFCQFQLHQQIAVALRTDHTERLDGFMLPPEREAVIFCRHAVKRLRDGQGGGLSRLRHDFFADDRVVLQRDIDLVMRLRLHRDSFIKRERRRRRPNDAPRSDANARHRMRVTDDIAVFAHKPVDVRAKLHELQLPL